MGVQSRFGSTRYILVQYLDLYHNIIIQSLHYAGTPPVILRMDHESPGKNVCSRTIRGVKGGTPFLIRTMI